MSELYKLPKGWEWTKWQKVLNVKNGKDYKEVLNPLGEYPIYGSGGIINYADKYLCNENSVIIGRKGTINNPLFVTEKFWNIDTAFGLESNEKYLIPMFLFYFSLQFNFLKLNTATTLPSLTKTKLQQILMPLPPLTEQKRIVTKLDSLFAKIDHAITLHQANIDDANALMASVLDKVFGELEEEYAKPKINEVANVKGGKRVPKGSKLSEEVTPYPYLRVTDFKDYGTISTEKMLYLSEEVYQQIKRYTITNEDLYITNVGNTIGKSGIIPSKLNGANLTENAVKLVYKDKSITSNKYMYYFTKSSIFITQMKLATKQMAVPKLAIKRLGEITVPFPPLQTQQKTVHYLDAVAQKVERLKAVQSEKMQNLKALKASLLDRAFCGEL